jgi:ABC-2 type transport system ATP-binding protein
MSSRTRRGLSNITATRPPLRSLHSRTPMSQTRSTTIPDETTAAGSDGAIVARSLRRSFKGGIEAVRDIDLSVATGEIFGFLGPNGAGKTTTVRMFCTLLPLTGGTATVAGLDVMREGAKVRRRIGVALQEIGLDPVQTGRELLELQCGLYGITGRERRERAEQLLELVGLTDAADRRTKTYSGGMKRRLDLASALVHSPDVLFLDEPTTGLDPASRLTIWEEVRRINSGGTTVFLTTQYLEEADQLCDRLAIIDEGRIVAEGTPEQLKAEMGHDVVSVTLNGADPAATEAALAGLPEIERVVTEPNALALYVEDGANLIAEVVRQLDRDGIRVGAISVSRPSLDDVFLKATGRRLEGTGHSQDGEAVTG